MSQITNEQSDKFLKEALEKILGEVQLRYNLTRDDAMTKVKALAYKTLPFRKVTIDAAFSEIEAAN